MQFIIIFYETLKFHNNPCLKLSKFGVAQINYINITY